MDLIKGDCLDVLPTIKTDSVDAIVTDPPYELGFMNKNWDRSGIAYNIKLWEQCLRVLKPGGYLLAFSGTRTYHRMACAVEDAGFEIRDMIQWIYSSGFPKSYNIGKAIDKIEGNERKVVGKGKSGSERNCMSGDFTGGEYEITRGTSEWEGYGTNLKPAHEPIVMARKPLGEKSIVKNVLKYGTGAINIDGCRIPTNENLYGGAYSEGESKGTATYALSDGRKTLPTNNLKKEDFIQPEGRFPANVICTDDALDDKSRYFDIDVWAEKYGILQFSKASKKDRGKGNIHPTVKPTHLVAWLVKLISREGHIVLDPFMGSGTTGVVCKILKRNFIGIEIDKKYCKIAIDRISEI